MSLAAKFCIIVFLTACQAKSFAKDLYILIVGESISSNCNQHIYEPSEGVFQIDLSGNKIPSSDPFLFADCQNGSTWILLGRKIITANYARSVTFMPIGVEGMSVNDWLPGGKAFEKLSNAIIITKEKSIRFDYAFWYQGPADADPPSDQYAKKLSQVLKYISINAHVNKWIIAQYSKCRALSDNEIAKAQIEVASRNILRRFPGPNTNALGSEFRYDNCHLNFKGQEIMADLWFQSMVSADKANSAVQKESLLKYFNGLFK
jgi:hypothetical protein